MTRTGKAREASDATAETMVSEGRPAGGPDGIHRCSRRSAENHELRPVIDATFRAEAARVTRALGDHQTAAGTLHRCPRALCRPRRESGATASALNPHATGPIEFDIPGLKARDIRENDAA